MASSTLASVTVGTTDEGLHGARQRLSRVYGRSRSLDLGWTGSRRRVCQGQVSNDVNGGRQLLWNIDRMVIITSYHKSPNLLGRDKCQVRPLLDGVYPAE
jgi:hypothetical protein